MKKILNFAFAVLLAASLSGCGNNLTPIATVDGEKVPQALYTYALKQAMSEISSNEGKSGNDFWKNGMVGDKKAADLAKEKAKENIEEIYAVRAQAKKEGIEITSEDRKEIDAQIEQQKESLGGADKYNQALKNIGIDDSIYRETLLNSKYETKMAEKYKSSLTDAQMKDYYNKNMKRVKHVLYKTVDDDNKELSEAEVAAAKTSAETIKAKAKSGEGFDKLVKEFSQDPGSVSQPDGYVLGPNNTSYVKPFLDAALKLAVGEVSDVVKTSFGYHVLKAYPILASGFDDNKVVVQDDMWAAEKKKIRANAKVSFDQAKLDSILVEE
ncbi:peptidylprolyl isomerase [Treponema sp. R6D11]